MKLQKNESYTVNFKPTRISNSILDFSNIVPPVSGMGIVSSPILYTTLKVTTTNPDNRAPKVYTTGMIDCISEVKVRFANHMEYIEPRKLKWIRGTEFDKWREDPESLKQYPDEYVEEYFLRTDLPLPILSEKEFFGMRIESGLQCSFTIKDIKDAVKLLDKSEYRVDIVDCYLSVEFCKLTDGTRNSFTSSTFNAYESTNGCFDLNLQKPFHRLHIFAIEDLEGFKNMQFYCDNIEVDVSMIGEKKVFKPVPLPEDCVTSVDNKVVVVDWKNICPASELENSKDWDSCAANVNVSIVDENGKRIKKEKVVYYCVVESKRRLTIDGRNVSSCYFK